MLKRGAPAAASAMPRGTTIRYGAFRSSAPANRAPSSRCWGTEVSAAGSWRWVSCAANGSKCSRTPPCTIRSNTASWVMAYRCGAARPKWSWSSPTATPKRRSLNAKRALRPTAITSGRSSPAAAAGSTSHWWATPTAARPRYSTPYRAATSTWAITAG